MRFSLDNINDHLLESVLLEYSNEEYESDRKHMTRRRFWKTVGGGLVGGAVGHIGGGMAGAALGARSAKNMGEYVGNIVASQTVGGLAGTAGGALLGRRHENKKWEAHKRGLPAKFQDRY